MPIDDVRQFDADVRRIFWPASESPGGNRRPSSSIGITGDRRTYLLLDRRIAGRRPSLVDHVSKRADVARPERRRPRSRDAGRADRVRHRGGHAVSRDQSALAGA